MEMELTVFIIYTHTHDRTSIAHFGCGILAPSHAHAACTRAYILVASIQINKLQ